MWIKIWPIIKTSLLSIFPLTIMVVFFHFSNIVPILADDLYYFIVGAILLILGMLMFNIGINSSIITIGDLFGSTLTKLKRFVVVLLILFFIGFFVTAAEPSVAILARQVPIQDLFFIVFVSVGAGIFLIIGVIRILFNRPINTLLMIGYLGVFILVYFADKGYVPMAFDSSGVTTGLMTVPFIMAIGRGIASSHGNKNNQNDSFGLVGLVCIGPIIFVLLMGIIAGVSPEVVSVDAMPVTNVFLALLKEMGSTAFSISLVLVPILIFFFFYQLVLIKLTKKRLIRILVGSIWLFFGMLLFLSGANFGFVGAATSFGKSLAGIDNVGIRLLIVALIGATTVLAEPSVHILGDQVEEFSDGVLKKSTLVATLSIGVALALIISVIRIEYQIPIMFFVAPGFIIALILTLFTPSMYTAIAADSGGAVTGAVAASFISPMIGGLALTSLGEGSFAEYGLGTIGLIAMIPLISMQFLGLHVKVKENHNRKLALQRIREADEAQIIYFN